MGRPALAEETAREITIRLIQAAQDLILTEGMENVTIRKIAKKARLNSALLYKYFQDLDELLLFSCVDLFKSYCYDLTQNSKLMEHATPREIYRITWRLFCQYAFVYPECMNQLFFSKHSSHLGHVIQAYYMLFPEQLEGISGHLQVMIRSADLYQRNLEVLRPLLRDRVPESRLHLINDLTVSYFNMLLNEKIAGGDQVDNAHQTARMLEACELLVTLGT